MPVDSWVAVLAAVGVAWTGRRPVADTLSGCRARRRDHAAAGDRARRTPGTDLQVVDGVAVGWVGAGLWSVVSIERAPREAARAPRPRRAA